MTSFTGMKPGQMRSIFISDGVVQAAGSSYKPASLHSDSEKQESSEEPTNGSSERLAVFLRPFTSNLHTVQRLIIESAHVALVKVGQCDTTIV